MEEVYADLLSRVGGMIEKWDSRRETEAPLFDPLGDVWEVDEIPVSGFLCSLLDPEGNHGQGRTYLDAFVRLLQRKGLDWGAGHGEGVRVQTEKPTPQNGRFDIVIEFENPRGCILIENKIGAQDQPRQISDYRDWLNENYPKTGFLVYLTPNGDPPSEMSCERRERKPFDPAKEQCCRLSWKSDMMPELSKWADATKAPEVRSFLRLYTRAISNKITGGFTMAERVEITKEIWKDRSSLEAAYAVWTAFRGAQEELRMEFMKCLKKKAQDESFKFRLGPEESERGFLFKKARWQQLWILFYFEGSPKSLYVNIGIAEEKGLREYEGYKAAAKFVADRIKAESGNPDCFLTTKRVDTKYRYWNDIRLLTDMLKMSKSDLCRYLLDEVKELAPIVEQADKMLGKRK